MDKEFAPFEMVLDCLSDGDLQIKSDLTRYVIHRSKFGRFAAARLYPQCHNIRIHDPQLSNIWKTLLKTVDKI